MNAIAPSSQRTLGSLIFLSRWLQAPLYIGLIGVLAIICIRFFSEFVHVTAVLWGCEESKLVLLIAIHLTFVISAVMLPINWNGQGASTAAPKIDTLLDVMIVLSAFVFASSSVRTFFPFSSAFDTGAPLNGM